MNDTIFVCCFESFCNLQRELQRLFNWNRALLDAIAQGGAFDEFEHKEPRTLVFFQSVDCCDVGMIERRK